MIDWGALVLSPVMDVFAQPIVVTPTVSQPSVQPYPAQGVFKAEEASIPLEDGEIVATTVYTLGIRLSDYPIPIVPEDQLAVAGFTFAIDQLHPDGQGGATLTLKRLT